jgi:WD repeat-containing protein 90
MIALWNASLISHIYLSYLLLSQLSPNATMIASAETCPKGNVFLWSVAEGRRFVALKPHAEGVTAVAFSDDGTHLVTAGLDAQRRSQIIVWNIESLVTQTPALSIVARQLSEFPVSRIRFSPFEENTLVACGRENIRFLRIRNGHVPARPVLLNEFTRGFVFSEIAFHSEPGTLPQDTRRPCAFFSSNRGMLLKVDCDKKVVLCAYQLHSGAISSLAVHSGYAVTGGTDNRLRVWPMDFSDFLLEAQHEAAVSSISISQSGRKLSVGTTAGTLGVLDVSEHRYFNSIIPHTVSKPCLSHSQ